VCIGGLAGGFEVRGGSIPSGMSPHIDPPLEPSKVGYNGTDFGVGIEIPGDERGHFGMILLELGSGRPDDGVGGAGCCGVGGAPLLPHRP
jgi:hypothetical protein